MSAERSPAGKDGDVDDSAKDPSAANHTSLKYSLLGPSLTKAGQDAVDQSVVCLCLSTKVRCIASADTVLMMIA